MQVLEGERSLTGSSTVIRISPGSASSSLNDLADRFLDEATTVVESLDTFELVEGRASLFGSGETPILEIVMKYDELTAEQLEALEQMLGWARASGATIDIKPIPDER